MRVKIAMRLDGIDLRDPDMCMNIPDELGELGLQAKGPISYVVVYSEDHPAAAAREAAHWARKIAALLPGVRVVSVYEELLNTAQIAARCGVAPEAARLWATGKRRASIRPFPAPREVIEQGTTGKLAPLFAWSEVTTWVRDVLGEDPEDGVRYLDRTQVADLNAELAHLDTTPSGTHTTWSGWRGMRSAAHHISSRAVGVEVSTSTTNDTFALMLGGLDDVLAANWRVTAPARRLTR